MKKSYKIDVDCANCANKMEIAAKGTPGVKDAVVNFMTLTTKLLCRMYTKTASAWRMTARYICDELVGKHARKCCIRHNAI